jgi:hypothetical protein
MAMRNGLTVAVLALLLASGPATARKPAETGTPAQIQQLMACRAMTDSAQRLACFDRESAAFQQAVAAKDLVFVDRERAKATRRSLFGFSMPSFGGLFGDDEDEDAIKQIESTVASAGRNGDGGWTISLADKTTWTQTNDAVLGLSPKTGQKVVVKRGVMGTYYLSVNGQPGIKVKRVG